MKHYLSIIIPCFNSKATVEEALKSVYEQHIHIPFEVILFDDGSNDGTKDLMYTLQKKYPHVRIGFHTKNKGGGATRNDAVSMSKGDIIFPLDSDDILPPDVLPKMIAYLDVKKCDGVGISKSIQFKNTNVNDVAYVADFGYLGQRIPFESLFENYYACALYSTFLITKKAFNSIHGYPENHGFDTQGLAFRFLANGLKAFVCPETVYYHRVHFNTSYYLREQNEGKIVNNWLSIIDEYIFLFIDSIKEKLFSSDMRAEEFPMGDIVNSVVNPYITGYKNYLQISGRNRYLKNLSKKQKLTLWDKYSIASEHIRNKKLNEGSALLLEVFKKGLQYPFIYKKLYLLGVLPQNDSKNSIYKKYLYLHETNRTKLQYARVKRLFLNYFISARSRFLGIINKLRFIYNVYHLKYILPLFKADINVLDNISSTLKIDVVFPTLDKDVEVVELVIDSIRRYVMHPIGQIIIISPPSKRIQRICKEKHCIFIDENTVLPINKKDIHYIVGGIDRSGWIFQQLLKWEAAKYVKNQYYLVTESDTIYIRPYVFEYKKKIIFSCCSNPPHLPYFENYMKLTGEKVNPIYNFTSHHCLYKKKWLEQLKHQIEKYCTMPWYIALWKKVDRTNVSAISDYENYGQFVYKNFRDNIVLEDWGNISIERSKLKYISKLRSDLKSKYKTMSFHSYNK